MTKASKAQAVTAVKSTTTQVQNSWRAVVRTIVQAVVGLAALIPFVLDAISSGDASSLGPGAAVALAVSGVITKVMALPQVEAFITRFIPWLAADKATVGGGDDSGTS